MNWKFWNRKSSPKPLLLRVRDENHRVAFTIKTFKCPLDDVLVYQAIERARNECVGPPIYLNLVSHNGSDLGIYYEVGVNTAFPYWAGHKPGTPEISPADRFLRKMFHRWVKPYYEDELALAKEGKW